MSRARDLRKCDDIETEVTLENSRQFPLSLSESQDEPIVDRVSCLVYSLTLKTQVIYSSEMSVDFQRNTFRYNLLLCEPEILQ
jgi:hypothetical protein